MQNEPEIRMYSKNKRFESRFSATAHRLKTHQSPRPSSPYKHGRTRLEPVRATICTTLWSAFAVQRFYLRGWFQHVCVLTHVTDDRPRLERVFRLVPTPDVRTCCTLCLCRSFPALIVDRVYERWRCGRSWHLLRKLHKEAGGDSQMESGLWLRVLATFTVLAADTGSVVSSQCSWRR